MTYNGWTNRETWLVNVWFSPETKSDIDAIQAAIEEDVATIPTYLQDFIDLGAINWNELKEHLDDDNEGEDDE